MAKNSRNIMEIGVFNGPLLGILDFIGNGSQLMNPDLSGAIFTLSLSILVLISQYVEGARYGRVY